jgi:predicted RNA-binding protein with PIN domain/phage shock protein A
VNELPTDVAAELVRLVGGYLRVTPPRSLPTSVRALRGFRPQGLQRRRAAVLKALDDDDLRAGIVEWLDDGNAPLSPEEAEILRIAAERPEGWMEQLAGLSTIRPPSGERPGPDPALAEKLARAEERAKRARAEVRKVRDEAQRTAGSLRREIASLKERIADLERSLAAARAEAQRERSFAESARSEADRLLRRARRDFESAEADAASARKRASEQRRERVAAQERAAELEREVASVRAELQMARRPLSVAPKSRTEKERRAPLPVPKGRLPEDPQTLDEWLSADNVRLLVDGYNVTKAEGGFGRLSLERQRERLVDEIAKLAARKRVPTTIVFDGSEVAPASSRRFRGLVAIEYSRPREVADDHLVALLGKGTEPAVLVTNDRDLQARAGDLGATIATSNQLLELIR